MTLRVSLGGTWAVWGTTQGAIMTSSTNRDPSTSIGWHKTYPAIESNVLRGANARQAALWLRLRHAFWLDQCRPLSEQKVDRECRLMAAMDPTDAITVAYFSDRGRLFQADRGRRFSAIVDAQRVRASGGSNVSQSSTISLKRLSWWLPSGRALGHQSSFLRPLPGRRRPPGCLILGVT